MAKLTDIQLLLLTTAATRDDGSLLPPPDQLADLGARVRRAIAALIKQGLIAEVDVSTDGCVWREEDGKRVGVVITDAGRTAVGAEASPPALSMTAEPITKIDTLLAMLRRQQGATLTEMIEATGWLSHTTRAALTRLRQKGHEVEKTKRGTRPAIASRQPRDDRARRGAGDAGDTVSRAAARRVVMPVQG